MTSSFEIVQSEGKELIVKIRQGYTGNDLLKFFLQQNTEILAFHEILPSLNQIFIQLVENTPMSRQFETVYA